MSPHIASCVVQFFSNLPKATKDADPALEQLTPGETKFLEELAQGFSCKEIAYQQGISVHGVHNYIRIIFEKLHVRAKVEASTNICAVDAPDR